MDEYNTSLPLRHLEDIEKEVQKEQRKLSKQYIRSINKQKLAVWWEQHPHIYLAPFILGYISGKLIRKL